MAGILYLIRLFVYHRERGFHSQENHELLKIMEERLFKFITIPAMVLSWVAGLGMIALNPSLLHGHWLHAKLGFVVILTITTLVCRSFILQLAKREQASPSGKMFRIINEIPTFLMLAILWLVIFKPF